MYKNISNPSLVLSDKIYNNSYLFCGETVAAGIQQNSEDCKGGHNDKHG